MCKYRIIPFDNHYKKDDFNCGIDELNQYLKKYANQDIKRGLAQIFIICPEDLEEIIGFYSLSASAIKVASLPEKIAKKLPLYPVPVSLLGRLALSKNYQGKGIGKLLLIDAIKRVIKASQNIAIYALVVDAKNEGAKKFYSRYGFMEIIDDNHRLFLPLKTASSLLAQNQ
ncbi:MAG TPA: GNAT family N-acetyltransferase [Allocoleopsis sp.]